MGNIATRTNGRIPPEVQRMTVIAVTYSIGEGTEGDPIRPAHAYFSDDGRHLWTLDGSKCIAYYGMDNQEPTDAP